MEGSAAVAFRAASAFFVDAVDLVQDGQWDLPAQGTWSVIELISHTNRAHTTIEAYLLDPIPPQSKESEYFVPESIAQRARDAVAALRSDPKRIIRETARRVTDLIDRNSADVILGSPYGTPTLGEYLPSRAAELTIHTLDLLRSLGAEVAPPSEALEESLEFVTRSSIRKGTGEVVLRALSGRGELPEGFSVY